MSLCREQKEKVPNICRSFTIAFFPIAILMSLKKFKRTQLLRIKYATRCGTFLALVVIFKGRKEF